RARDPARAPRGAVTRARAARRARPCRTRSWPRAARPCPSARPPDSTHLEEPLDLVDLPAIGHEQNDMIVRLDHEIMMRHQHGLAANDRADRRAARQADLADGAPGDFRLLRRSMRDGLDRLGGAASE